MARYIPSYARMCHTPAYTPYKPTVEKERKNFREAGYGDAERFCDGLEPWEPNGEPFVHVTAKTKTRKPMTAKQVEKRYGKGYTPEIIEAATEAYWQGFNEFMEEYGQEAIDYWPEGSPERTRIEEFLGRS